MTNRTEAEARVVGLDDLVGRLRTAAARTTRLNADVALLAEAAIAAADELERRGGASRTQPVLSDAQIIDLLPAMQHGWTPTEYGMWVARAVERAITDAALLEYAALKAMGAD